MHAMKSSFTLSMIILVITFFTAQESKSQFTATITNGTASCAYNVGFIATGPIISPGFTVIGPGGVYTAFIPAGVAITGISVGGVVVAPPPPPFCIPIAGAVGFCTAAPPPLGFLCGVTATSWIII